MTLNKKLSIRLTMTAASLIMAAPAAMAQAQDGSEEGLHLRALLGVEHDSNVLRVPNGTSDTAVMGGVGLRYEKRFGLQRVHADVEFDTYRYQHQSGLNYNTLNYSLGWNWQVTPRLHGVLSADRRQYRTVTTDPLAVTNLVGRRTEREELAEGTFDLTGNWRVMAGALHTRAEDTQPRSWDASPDETYAQAGVGYEFPSGSLVTARVRRGKGEYKDPSFAIANRSFHDTEEELGVRWALTGKTTLDGAIAHRKREHDGAPQLDFSGWVGHANATWDITGKTRLVAGARRELSASGDVTGGNVVSNRVFISPVWAATAKTSFNFRYDHTTRDWKDVPVASFNRGRSETIEATSVGVDWQALRTISVGAYVRGERLRSSLATGYHATVYGITAKANF